MDVPLGHSTQPRKVVFVLGLPKCGTTSLQHALKSAGFGAVHCYAPKPWGPVSEDRFVGHRMVEAVAKGLPPLALLPPWVDAVTQMDCWWLDEESGYKDAHAIFPQMTLLEELDGAYPDAKYILNTRSPCDWLRSVTAYGPLRRILEDAELPGLPQGAGSEDRELLDWFEAHALRVRRRFAGGRLLEIALEEGDAAIHAKLEAFLGLPLEWGHHNTTTWAPQKVPPTGAAVCESH